MNASRFLGSDTGAAVVAVCWLGACYVIGVGHGLWLAWTQPARMAHWAKRVENAQRKLNELEDRADGVVTDRELRALRRVALGKGAESGEAGRTQRANADVPARATGQALEPGQGPQAVSA